MRVSDNADQARTMGSLPQSQAVRLIGFDDARVFPHPLVPINHFLLVTGTKPFANMRVQLVPRVYIRQPDFWGIEVTGSLPGVGVPGDTPYSVEIELLGISPRIGIEIIGAEATKKIKIKL